MGPQRPVRARHRPRLQATPRRTRSGCTSPTPSTGATAGPAPTRASPGSSWPTPSAPTLGHVVRRRGGHHVPALHAERDREPGRARCPAPVTSRSARPSTARAAPATSPGSARSAGCGPAARAATSCSTPRRPPTRTTSSAGRRSSRRRLHGQLAARVRAGRAGPRLGDNGGMAMDLGLSGSVAVVTGASRGIGLAVVRGLADERRARHRGRPEVVRRAGRAGADRAGAGGRGGPGHPDGPARLVALAGDRIDILVNNVGAAPARTGGFLSVTDEDWQASITLNLLAAVRTTRSRAAAHAGGGPGRDRQHQLGQRRSCPTRRSSTTARPRPPWPASPRRCPRRSAPRASGSTPSAPARSPRICGWATAGSRRRSAAATGAKPEDVASQAARQMVTGRFTQPGRGRRPGAVPGQRPRRQHHRRRYHHRRRHDPDLVTGDPGRLEDPAGLACGLAGGCFPRPSRSSPREGGQSDRAEEVMNDVRFYDGRHPRPGGRPWWRWWCMIGAVLLRRAETGRARTPASGHGGPSAVAPSAAIRASRCLTGMTCRRKRWPGRAGTPTGTRPG